MPIYEFICQGCDCRFEELVLRQRDLDEVACSACGSPEVEKTFSVFGMAGSLEHPSSGGCGSCRSGNCAGCGSHSHGH